MKSTSLGLVAVACAILRLIPLASAQATVGGPWIELGPRPFFGLNPLSNSSAETMSGQVSAIAVDLAHDKTGNLVYVGSSSGGLWMSKNGLDATPHFIPLSDQTRSLSVGSVALNTKTDPPTIYVGTGAPDNSANISSYTGTGILISQDGGMSWSLVESADNGVHPFKGMGFSSILVDPVDPKILLASTGVGTDPNFPHAAFPQGNPAFQHLGIYRSEDGGGHWKQVRSTNASSTNTSIFHHTDLLYEPTQGLYFAGISEQGLFKSTDQGKTWNCVALPGLDNKCELLPGANPIFRISLATRNGVLWALLMRHVYPVKGSGVNAFELFQSNDEGNSWSPLALDVTADAIEVSPAVPKVLPFKGFLMYVAAPKDPDTDAHTKTLLVATEHLFKKENIEDPDSTWVSIEQNLHGDQHAISFANASWWYVGDDGGAWATTDQGKTWKSLNEDLHTMEFFSAAANSADSGAYAGGTQDNGSVLTAGSPDWRQIVFGDGMYVAADPQDAGAFFISDRGNISYVLVSNPNSPKSVINFGGLALPSDFLTPYEVLTTDARLYQNVGAFPGFNFGRSRILLTGANNPWLVAFDPGAVSNTPGSPCSSITGSVCVQLTDGIKNVINYIAPVPGDPTSAYLTAGSALYHLSNISFAGHATVTPITGGPINGDVLGHVAVSPTDRLYLVKVGFLDGQKIFSSPDGGKNWINISGNLPNIPINWVTIDKSHDNLVFVATNTGVYVATDGGIQGEQWRRLGTGLPNVPVIQTQISPSKKLVAGTYGRGVWTEDISKNPLADLNEDGRVDCADLAIVRVSFGKRTGDAGFDARADVNGDGVVDIRDLTFVSQQVATDAGCPNSPGPDLISVKSHGQPDNVLGFCTSSFGNTQTIIFSVENQGTSLAPPFTTEIRFLPAGSFPGASVFLPSSGSMAPGETRDFGPVAIPAGAFQPDVNFNIIVRPVAGESNTGNNATAGKCIG